VIGADVSYILMLVVVYGAVVAFLFRLSRVFTGHQARIEALRQQIMVMGQENLRLEDYQGKRQAEIDTVKREIVEIQASIQGLEESIGPDRMRSRPRIYLANDRRLPTDQEYLIKVSNERMLAATRPPVYRTSWATPRTYVLWASSMEAARNNAEGRFPTNAHFLVESVERSPYFLGDRKGAR